MDQQQISYWHIYLQQPGRSCRLELNLVGQDFRRHMIHGRFLLQLVHSKHQRPLIFVRIYHRNVVERYRLGLILFAHSWSYLCITIHSFHYRLGGHMGQQQISYWHTCPQQPGMSCMLELSLVEQGFRKHMIRGRYLAWLGHSKNQLPQIFVRTYHRNVVERCSLGLILSGRNQSFLCITIHSFHCQQEDHMDQQQISYWRTYPQQPGMSCKLGLSLAEQDFRRHKIRGRFLQQLVHSMHQRPLIFVRIYHQNVVGKCKLGRIPSGRSQSYLCTTIHSFRYQLGGHMDRQRISYWRIYLQQPGMSCKLERTLVEHSQSYPCITIHSFHCLLGDHMGQLRISYWRICPQPVGKSCMLGQIFAQQGFHRRKIHERYLAWLGHSKHQWPQIFAHIYHQNVVERCSLGLKPSFGDSYASYDDVSSFQLKLRYSQPGRQCLDRSRYPGSKKEQQLLELFS